MVHHLWTTLLGPHLINIDPCLALPSPLPEEEVLESTPVLKINDHATGGRRTKDILGGPKGWGPKKKVANVEIYVIFEVFAFCGGRTKTDFKDRDCKSISRRKIKNQVDLDFLKAFKWIQSKNHILQVSKQGPWIFLASFASFFLNSVLGFKPVNFFLQSAKNFP